MVQALLEHDPRIRLAVSATTRARRPGEKDGVHYWFLTRPDFDRRVAEGEFLEWVDYVGNRYGTLRSEIDRIRREGRVPILELELDGALAVKDAVPNAITIFVDAPLAELERRLRERATESAGEIGERIALARRQKELAHVRLCRRERPSRARGRRVLRHRGARAERRRYHGAPMIHPRIDELMDQVDSRYALVIVAAKRARQINNYHHQLGEGTFDEFPPPLVESRSKNYLTMALEEISEGKITYAYRR